jgi:hypothetical protein
MLKRMQPSSIALLLLVFAPPVNAQEQERVPLFQNTVEIPFLEEAKGSSDRAIAMETQHSYLQAAQQYEAEISRAQQSEILSTSYSVTLVLATAHLDAARVRIKYAGTLKDLGLHEQNQSLITQHLAQIPDLVVAAAKKVDPGVSLDKFKCRAYELLGHGSFLQGSVNRSAPDIETAIRAYERTLPCDPEAAPRTKQIIDYLKSVRRDMFISTDSIEKAVSKVVSLSFGKWGNFVSVAVDIGYEYVKAHPRTPPL